MSQRSHIASSGRTAICACSAACSGPSRTSSGKSSASRASSSSYQRACVWEVVRGGGVGGGVDAGGGRNPGGGGGDPRGGDVDGPKGEGHAEGRAPVEQRLDV